MEIRDLAVIDTTTPGFQYVSGCMYVIDSSGLSWAIGSDRSAWQWVEGPENSVDAVGVIDAITRLLSVNNGKEDRKFKPRQEESEHGRWE